MSELLAKLTNLSYEFFGVVIPGLLSLVMLALVVVGWGALGRPEDLQGLFNVYHGLLMDVARHSASDPWPTLVSLALAAYFLGQFALWQSRSWATSAEQDPRERGDRWPWIGRVLLCLQRRMLRPDKSVSSHFERELEWCQEKLGLRVGLRHWPEFYPVAKCLIRNELTYSLLSTYQNKYTLHRSIAAIASVLVWASMATIIWAALQAGAARPHSICLWAPVTNLILGVAGAWAFSSSFYFHWRMWGDTVVAECSAMLRKQLGYEAAWREEEER